MWCTQYVKARCDASDIKIYPLVVLAVWYLFSKRGGFFAGLKIASLALLGFCS